MAFDKIFSMVRSLEICEQTETPRCAIRGDPVSPDQHGLRGHVRISARSLEFVDKNFDDDVGVTIGLPVPVTQMH